MARLDRLGPAHHSPRHFLHEQRDAVSSLDYVLPNVLRQREVVGWSPGALDIPDLQEARCVIERAPSAIRE